MCGRLRMRVAVADALKQHLSLLRQESPSRPDATGCRGQALPNHKDIRCHMFFAFDGGYVPDT